MPSQALARRSPWDGVLLAGQHGARVDSVGMTIAPVQGNSICNVMALRNASPPVESAFWRGFDFELPEPGRFVTHDGLRMAWDGPGRWRACAEGLEEGELYNRLSKGVGASAGVVEQSHGLVAVRIVGAKTPAVLAKGTCVDLHRDQFGPGNCALTQIAHMGVHLSQLDDAPTYEIQLFRSMAGSFAEWLMASGGEYGIEVA